MEKIGIAGKPVKRVLLIYLFNLILSLLLLHSVILSLFTPLPQMFCHLRLGRWAGLTIATVLFILAGLSGISAGLGYMVQFGIPGVLLAESIRRNFSIGKSFLIVVTVVGATSFLLLNYLAMQEGKTVRETISSNVVQIIDESVKVNRRAGMPGEQIEELQKLTPFIAEIASRIFPALIIAGTLITLWLNVMVLNRLLIRLGASPPFGDLSLWAAPEHLVWGIITGGISVVSGIEILKIAGLNILIVFFVIYFFQGMAVVSYYFKRKGVPDGIKAIAYFLIIIYLHVLAFLVGLFDTWFDFRKLSRPKEA